MILAVCCRLGFCCAIVTGHWQNHAFLCLLCPFLSGNGAIRKSSIDLVTTDEDINNFLESTVHQPPPSTSDPEVELDAQCWKECCSKSPYSLTLDAMLQNFSDVLSQHEVKPGTLLGFKSDFTSRSIVCLLGVTLQKPKLQTLMCARFNATDRVEFVLEDGIPKICTARQLFKDYIDDFLRSASGLDDPTASEIQVEMEVWNHSVEWFEGNKLVAVANSLCHSLHISSCKRRVTKSAPGKLPFGMKMSSKPKPPMKKTTVKKKPLAREKPRSFKGNESPEIIDSDSDACAESDSLTISSTSDNEDRGTAMESEPVDPISTTMAHEERRAKRLQKEMEESQGFKAQLRQQCLTGEAPPGFQTSFFSKEIGLDHGAIAVSGRSICLQCKIAIPKGSVRFAWFYNRLRPHGWLHKGCVVQMVQGSGLHEQAAEKLGQISSQATGSAGVGEVQQAASEILDLLDAGNG